MIHIQLPLTKPYTYPEKPDDLGHKHHLKFKRSQDTNAFTDSELFNSPMYWFLCIRCGSYQVISQHLFWVEHK